jgi:hypothetical protein
MDVTVRLDRMDVTVRLDRMDVTVRLDRMDVTVRYGMRSETSKKYEHHLSSNLLLQQFSISLNIFNVFHELLYGHVYQIMDIH